MIRQRLGKDLLFFDGGMGTLLQEKGLAPGELPETWNLTHSEEIYKIHRQYIEAGSDIILTNTFGANALKFHDDSCSLEEIIKAAVSHVKKAEREALLQTGDERKIYTALDVGPTGKLLKPMGDLEFETAYEAFKEVVILGEQAGADLIHIETMSDTYELKAAVLAAKENTSLPVFATVIFDERKKLLTGADVSSVVALLEGLGVDALGINCAMGPKEMLPVLEELIKYSSVPIIVKPNAGLPKQRDGKTYYDVTEDEFAAYMEQIVRMGACVIGGCCGTTPEHIRAVLLVHGQQNLTVGLADEGVFARLHQLLFQTREAINFAVADHIAAVHFKRLHPLRRQAHDGQTAKAQQAELGLGHTLVVRAAAGGAQQILSKRFLGQIMPGITHDAAHCLFLLFGLRLTPSEW